MAQNTGKIVILNPIFTALSVYLDMRHFQKKKKVQRVIFYRVNSANSACQKKKISERFDDQRVNSANSASPWFIATLAKT